MSNWDEIVFLECILNVLFATNDNVMFWEGLWSGFYLIMMVLDIPYLHSCQYQIRDLNHHQHYRDLSPLENGFTNVAWKFRTHADSCFIADFPPKKGPVNLVSSTRRTEFLCVTTWWPLFVLLDVVNVSSVRVVTATGSTKCPFTFQWFQQSAVVALCACVFVQCVGM